MSTTHQALTLNCIFSLNSSLLLHSHQLFVNHEKVSLLIVIELRLGTLRNSNVCTLLLQDSSHSGSCELSR